MLDDYATRVAGFFNRQAAIEEPCNVCRVGQ